MIFGGEGQWQAANRSATSYFAPANNAKAGGTAHSSHGLKPTQDRLRPGQAIGCVE